MIKLPLKPYQVEPWSPARSNQDDWPTHTFTIVMNERARYLMTARRMRDMGFGEYTVQDYLEA